MENIKAGYYTILEFINLQKSLIITLILLPLISWGALGVGETIDFTQAYLPAFYVGIAGGIASFFIIPWYAKSNIKELHYSLDWLFHVMSIIFAGIYCFIVALPLCAIGF